jgi:mycobactin lysine-N-oxygenase
VEIRDVERSLGFTLAVENLTPALHLPVLAGPAQGPGFPNLSCLGLLADRILQPCLTRESQLGQEYNTTDV